MGLSSILRSFGAILLIIGVSMIAPLGLAMMTNGPAGAYSFAIVVTITTGCGALVVSMRQPTKSDFRGALVVILLWWCVAPLFGALPFFLSGLPPGDAYFEAVSAITTTGAWLSHEAAVASPADALWRALMQWLGGLASLAIAAAIFIRPAFIGIDTILPPFSRGDHESYLRALRNAVSAFFAVYAGVTAICAIMVNAAGAPIFDAIILALSGVSTGGFVINPDGVDGYGIIVAASLLPIMVFGGANFIVFAQLARGVRRGADEFENQTFLLMAVVIGLVFWIMAGAKTVEGIFPQIFNAFSLLSTSGIMIGENPPLTVALVTAMIGGAAVSTAGGFKILRWVVIMRRAREELRRLIMPNAVQGLRRVSNEFGVWTHFLVFTTVLGVLVIGISAAGHNFDVVAAAATAAISNTGPLLYIADGDISGYNHFDPAIRWLLILAMIIGRLEAAAALALLNPLFWRS